MELVNLINQQTLILGLSESWLDGNIDNSSIALPGFQCYCKDRNRHGGGVVNVVSASNRVRRENLENDKVEAIWTKVKPRRTAGILVCNLYRPPNGDREFFKHLIVMVELAASEGKETILLCDFNCYVKNSGHGVAELISMATEFNLDQMIQEPTRVTENTESMIDLLYTSCPEHFSDTGCAPVAMSDHHMIYGVHMERMQRPQHSFREIRCLAKCVTETFLLNLEVAPWRVLDIIDDIDDRWEAWKTIFFEVCNFHAPVRRVRTRKHSLPWIDNKIRRLIKTRSYYLTKATKSRSLADWEKYKSVRNKLNSELRKAKLASISSSSNPRDVWRDIS